jgi:hypothetical protein
MIGSSAASDVTALRRSDTCYASTIMNTVAATPDEISAMVSYRDAQRRNLKQAPFFAFRTKRWYREKVAEIDSYIKAANVIERVFSVPGFKRRASRWNETKNCYYTEIGGIVCEIDECVQDHCLSIQLSDTSQVTVRECPDGEMCTAIIISADIGRIEDISDAISRNTPARSVFPGKYESIVDDINACAEGLFPHERPEYINDDVYWFHMHDEYHRFVAAWSARKDA